MYGLGGFTGREHLRFFFLAYTANTTWEIGGVAETYITGKTLKTRWEGWPCCQTTALPLSEFSEELHNLFKINKEFPWETLLTNLNPLPDSNWDFVMFSGNLNDSSPHPSVDSPAALNSPLGRCGLRFSSDSSYRSVMTDDSDQTSVFGDLLSPSPMSAASTTDDGCFFTRDFTEQGSSRRFSASNSHHHRSLSRTSSSSLADSSSSLSPSWEETRITSLFGTLPRKSRKASVRKHIFKLIPGLQRSVEEDEE